MTGWLLVVVLLLLASGCRRGETVRIFGGPTGGTFQNIAAGIARLLDGEMPALRVRSIHSGGSVDNLFQVERGGNEVALVYSGDAYLGSRGELRRGESATVHVLALAKLYGAAAQLVVLADSDVYSPSELRGRRIAIGNPGSGSALAALRYFHSLGIWEDVIPIYIGFDMGLEDLRQRNVDAVWMLVGVPNLSLRKFGQDVSIRLLDLIDELGAGTLAGAHPYYSLARIPAGTYPGQAQDVSTFQDDALLVANQRMDEKFVHALLNIIFSDKGVAALRTADPAAAGLDARRGAESVAIPLHPGAERYWREKGKLGQRGMRQPGK